MYGISAIRDLGALAICFVFDVKSYFDVTYWAALPNDNFDGRRISRANCA